MAATYIWFIIKQDGEIYVEKHRSPAKVEDIEVDRKQILDYTLDPREVDARLRLAEAAS